MFPARAGMSRINAGQIAHLVDVPRASGDEPPGAYLVFMCAKCSPRERG